MAKKYFALGQEKGFIGDKPTTKAKPREIIDITIDYRYKRDMIMLNDLFTSEETKESIKEKYGL